MSTAPDEPHNRIYWYNWEPNFGDKVGPYLFQHLSGRSPVHTPLNPSSSAPVYWTVGSILQQALLSLPHRAVVWGSGIFCTEKQFAAEIPVLVRSICNCSRFFPCKKKQFARPRAIHACRGPYTQKRCTELGFDCPQVYGDPAVLLPLVFKPSVEPCYDFGIIPHYVHYADVCARYGSSGVPILMPGRM